MPKEYIFSVIIPVYNAGKYLEDAVMSIVNQSIGFDNIQLIMVDDGSTDESFSICQNYASIYHDNVVCIKQENSGVSHARNKGLMAAEGKFISFLDADDMWQSNAMEKAYGFFCKHSDISVIACAMEYFEAKSGMGHPLNRKFTKDRVINILKNPSDIQMHMSSCFFRKEVLCGYFYNENLRYAEDSLLLNTIIMKCKQYGALKSIHYMYRKRLDETSAIDKCTLDPRFYNQTVEMFHCQIIKESMQEFHCVCPYVQNMLMYDLQWRIKRDIPENILSCDDKEKYINLLCDILSVIDDSVIMSQRNMWSEHKLAALCMKYRKDIRKDLVQVGQDLFLNTQYVLSCASNAFVKIAYLTIQNGMLTVEGLINTSLTKEDYDVCIYVWHKNEEHVHGKFISLSLSDYKKKEKKCVYGHYYYEQYFKAEVEIPGCYVTKFEFMFSYHNSAYAKTGIGFMDTCRLNTSLPFGYLKTENNITEWKKNRIIIRNNSRKLYIKKEIKYLHGLFKKHRYEIMLYRIFYYILKIFTRKEIWIISDRNNAACDNGEAFFKYMQSIKSSKRIYFAISKKSKDYKKMKRIGKVVNADSMWYKLLFLLSSKIISSQANDSTINAFGKNKRFIKDLYKFDFIFLQHGIIKDDLSLWLNKMNKDIKMFVTSSEEEYKSVLSGDYCYGTDIVKLTGLPRHDYLETSHTENKIAIMPTWRYGITGCFDETGSSIYNPAFKETDFFKFYNDLINNKELLDVMSCYHYKGIFCLHPMFANQINHFQGNGIFEICSDVEYKDIFETSSLLVTDYSSVFFDFAYLRKPVVYSQFDKKEFFSTHSYDKGYFDYERDGFGSVCGTVDETVKNIIYLIKNNCIPDDIYYNRMKNFFLQGHGQNCSRVYNEIMNI